VGEDEDNERGGAVEDGEATYFVDTTRLSHWDYAPSYDRDIDAQDVLGQQQGPPSNTDLDLNTHTDTRHCFNCGLPSHTLSDCPSPRNHALISLSRQLFTFNQQLQQSAHRQALGDFERIHVVEGRKQEKLDWLDWFEPGEVRGALLREAIGLDWDGDEGASAHADGEWLRNMAVWGYPKGWTGERDPRYEVMRRIEGEVIDDSDEEEEEEVFLIFRDVGEQEKITFTTPSQLSPFNTVPQTPNEDPTPSPPKIHRWASYPNTHFSSALLPIYTGYALPPLSADPSPTFTSDRQALWVNVTSGNGPPQPPPPPPSTSPPPLPPPPDKPPLPKEELDGEAEMDFSDSD
jgi:zinc finger CCHC domain-containing protein 8